MWLKEIWGWFGVVSGGVGNLGVVGVVGAGWGGWGWLGVVGGQVANGKQNINNLG